MSEFAPAVEEKKHQKQIGEVTVGTEGKTTLITNVGVASESTRVYNVCVFPTLEPLGKKNNKKKHPPCLKPTESSAAKMQNRSSGVICAGGTTSPAVDPHRSSDGCTPEAHFDKDCG